jgi:hypothetical protein
MSRAREVSKIVLTVENFDAVEYSSIPPANPKQGALWVDTSTVNPLIKAYNGNDWDTLGSAPVPIITGISPSNISGSASTAIIVNGTNFESGSIVKLVDNEDNELHVLSTTFNNSQSLQFLIPALTASAGPYDIKVTNTDNQFSIFENSLGVGSAPIWVTQSGNIGNIYNIQRNIKTFNVLATDPDGASIVYSLVGGSLPTGMSLSTGGTISGATIEVASDTTYSFTIRASDENTFVDREFNIVVKSPIKVEFSYTGTNQSWTVPNGLDRLDVKVWGASGGGGTSYFSYFGGCGGFSTGRMQVLENQNLIIAIGAGGHPQATGAIARYGHFGTTSSGLTAGTGQSCGGGGGLSGIFDGTITQANALVISGGGGGGGADQNNQGTRGGAGGGGNQSGQQGEDKNSGTSASGRGGTVSAGGIRGVAIYSSPNATGGNNSINGNALHGGHASTIPSWTEGGGGGSGYFGGGPGSHSSVSGRWGTAGGGSGYFKSEIFTNNVGYTGSYNSLPSEATNDPDYVSGVAAPVSGNYGGNGLVVLRY